MAHSKAEIAFEQAPDWMVQACNDAYFHHMWIYAQTSRPEGTYILAYGSIWVFEDVESAHPPKYLDNDGNGEIDLIRKDHSCNVLWDADNAFNGYFPLQRGNLPTREQASTIQDLAVDLIRREEKIFGGRQGFFKALAATGHGIPDQDSAMIPPLEALKSGKNP